MHIVSFQLAKQLKDAGWPQEEDRVWQYYNLETGKQCFDNYVSEISTWQEFYVYAPTLGELMRKLPPRTELIVTIADENDKVMYRLFLPDTDEQVLACELADTPEDATALAWITLTELGVVESA